MALVWPVGEPARSNLEQRDEAGLQAGPLDGPKLGRSQLAILSFRLRVSQLCLFMASLQHDPLLHSTGSHVVTISEAANACQGYQRKDPNPIKK